MDVPLGHIVTGMGLLATVIGGSVAGIDYLDKRTDARLAPIESKMTLAEADRIVMKQRITDIDRELAELRAKRSLKAGVIREICAELDNDLCAILSTE